MSKSTSLTSQNKAWTRLVRWLAGRLEAAGHMAFADDDMTALKHGWQIIPRHHGLGRHYRDPRFDTLLGCPRCQGSGALDSLPCPHCHGAGRICRPAPSHSEGGGRGGQGPFAASK